tara:strand:- start:381 stop:1280 length:900 start_codon:yes stop_codon:yes gene_type:complete
MYIDVCDGNMQEGSLRADVNLSVKKPNAELGTRCEIKNMNSFKFIRQAIEYESKRQIQVLESGGKIDQNTLLFDTSTGETRAMRSKEFAHDYRYFPDPDLLPVHIAEDQIEKVKSTIGELPQQKLQRYVDEFKLEKDVAKIVISEKAYAEFFENLISAKLIQPKLAASWLVGDIFSFIKDKDLQIVDIADKSSKIIQLLEMIEKGTISSKVAKDILIEILQNNKEPVLLVKELGLEQVSDNEELERIVEEALIGEEDNIEKFQSGSDRVLGYFVGKCLKATKGKGNPKVINDLLIKKLK